MSVIKLEARDYLNYLQSGKRIRRLAMYKGTKCVGRGQALVLSEDDRIAVMLEDCGDPADSGVLAGNLVNYVDHPENESRIVGTPASVRA